MPALPFVFDKPVEHAVEWIFHKGFEIAGGQQAVSSGAIAEPASSKGKPKEKEL